ncbi:substrate-binding domain-containing protein [Kitasatospora sp. NPDC059571]|uniref:substrate-binding domain-containing protein n=1 Tax=Kitasatospora sp. NPDC059571 TaxID=3346871 RepID=UPI0036AFFC5D
MDREITGLSSMATRQLLAELCGRLRSDRGTAVRFESAGGVEVVRRVREGAAADLLVLSEDALAALEREGHLAAGTLRPLWVSQVVAAVPNGSPAPALDSAADLRAALLAARRIAYSTGPSGTALVDLTARLGLADVLAPRLVQAPPGVPAGSLLASGAADLAFQQHSELMDLPGVTVVGPLPGDTAISTTFSGAVLTASTEPARAARVLGLLGSDEASAAARAKGMRPA